MEHLPVWAIFLISSLIAFMLSFSIERKKTDFVAFLIWILIGISIPLIWFIYEINTHSKSSDMPTCGFSSLSDIFFALMLAFFTTLSSIFAGIIRAERMNPDSKKEDTQA